MVEYFSNRPECTKEQRIEGLELLGATIANKRNVYDIEKAFLYIKRGMEERFEKKSCPLLKKQMKPLEIYQNRKESQTLEELVLLQGDDHAIHMEGLIIRERESLELIIQNFASQLDTVVRFLLTQKTTNYALVCGTVQWRETNVVMCQSQKI